MHPTFLPMDDMCNAQHTGMLTKEGGERSPPAAAENEEVGGSGGGGGRRRWRRLRAAVAEGSSRSFGGWRWRRVPESLEILEMTIKCMIVNHFNHYSKGE